MFNLAFYLYNIVTLIPCSAVAVCTYFAYSEFFSNSESSITNKDPEHISKLNNFKLSSLNSIKKAKAHDLEITNSDKELLSKKLETLNTEKTNSHSNILFLTEELSNISLDISLNKKTIEELTQEKLSKHSEEESLIKELSSFAVDEANQQIALNLAQTAKLNHEEEILKLTEKQTALEKEIIYKNQTFEQTKKELAFIKSKQAAHALIQTKASADKDKAELEYLQELSVLNTYMKDIHGPAD